MIFPCVRECVVLRFESNHIPPKSAQQFADSGQINLFLRETFHRQCTFLPSPQEFDASTFPSSSSSNSSVISYEERVISRVNKGDAGTATLEISFEIEMVCPPASLHTHAPPPASATQKAPQELSPRATYLPLQERIFQAMNGREVAYLGIRLRCQVLAKYDLASHWRDVRAWYDDGGYNTAKAAAAAQRSAPTPPGSHPEPGYVPQPYPEQIGLFSILFAMFLISLFPFMLCGAVPIRGSFPDTLCVFSLPLLWFLVCRR